MGNHGVWLNSARALAWALASAVIVVTPGVAGAVTYSVTDLPPPSGGATSYGAAINASSDFMRLLPACL